MKRFQIGFKSVSNRTSKVRLLSISYEKIKLQTDSKSDSNRIQIGHFNKKERNKNNNIINNIINDNQEIEIHQPEIESAVHPVIDFISRECPSVKK